MPLSPPPFHSCPTHLFGRLRAEKRNWAKGWVDRRCRHHHPRRHRVAALPHTTHLRARKIASRLIPPLLWYGHPPQIKLHVVRRGTNQDPSRDGRVSLSARRADGGRWRQERHCRCCRLSRRHGLPAPVPPGSSIRISVGSRPRPGCATQLDAVHGVADGGIVVGNGSVLSLTGIMPPPLWSPPRPHRTMRIKA